MAEYYLRKLDLPNEIIDIIINYLPATKFKNSIKNKEYLSKTGFWFQRIIVSNIVDIPRDNISYFDWYKIFHYKDYSMLIKYENKLVTQLLKNKSKEEIEKIHMDNINNCHHRHYMSYRFIKDNI